MLVYLCVNELNIPAALDLGGAWRAAKPRRHMAASCWRVPLCVYDAWAVLRCRDTVLPGHHGRWHSVGAVTSRPAWRAAVLYQCLNAPYTQWPERFPPLQSGAAVATTVAWYRTRTSTP